MTKAKTIPVFKPSIYKIQGGVWVKVQSFGYTDAYKELIKNAT